MEYVLSHYIHSVQNNGTYVVALGKDVSILTINGELVAHRKDLRNPYKSAFLTENIVLVECHKLREYVALSLHDGRDIFRIKIPRIDLSQHQFYVSPDKKYVYDLAEVRCETVLIRIDIENREADMIELDIGLRVTLDLKVDHRGVLCLLQKHQEMIGDKYINLCGVRYEYFDTALGIGSSYYWQSKWQFEHPRTAIAFGDDTHTVITSDLMLYDIDQDILEPWGKSDDISTVPDYYPQLHKSFDGKYAIISGATQTLIIDLKKRQLVARYFTHHQTGCIVGDTFWQPTDKGILKKPFPIIEQDDKMPI